ncbi:MAG TPA: hypothetical protein VLB44_19070, partial [Kofleriaceae bacterium]|nr:hypothetical protein [Kofleriaceae bacterium]
MGPVRELTIEGRTEGISQDIGRTPTLSWLAPTLGQPDRYRVIIHEMLVQGSTATRRPVASIVTTATTVRVPPDVLVPGKRYSFEIIAMTKPQLPSSASYIETMTYDVR